MSITNDSQKLEPGNRVRLFEVDGSAFGADILRFHSHTLPYTESELQAAGGDETKLPAKSIWWQGNEYGPWPVEVTDIEMSTDGQAFRPKLSLANQNGLITALCIRFNDMAQARVIIHETLEHYLDARNFPGGNPGADPEQEVRQIWYIDRRSVETDAVVEFELSSPVDLRNRVIPTRQIHSLCTWCARGWYRTGKGCDYAGDRYFDEDGNPVDDPAKDVCGGLLSDCRKRFGNNEPLSFGGTPGSALIRV